MAEKVTMQDIADATGYSRNTVSKALNGNPSVPDSTRAAIISKAAEMNYKKFSNVPWTEPEKRGGTIALFTHSMPGTSHFGSRFISSFTEQISRKGYTLTMYILQSSDVRERRLPANFSVEENDGILCIELFSPEYSQFLCKLGLPTLFADAFVHEGFDALASDKIMMENRSGTKSLTSHMIENGAKSIGFLGDRRHCLSFSERFEGYLSALKAAKIDFDEKKCILEDDSCPYGSVSWLQQKLSQMDALPDGFVCANDYIAIALVGALKRMGLSVPEDIMAAGFDDAPEARVLDPKLSTVAIPGQEMGSIGAFMMLNRIRRPNLPFQTAYVETAVKRRRSTERP